MSKLQKIKEKLAALIEQTIKVEMAVVKTDKAILMWDNSANEDLKEGVDVYSTNESGERVAVADGEYVTEDGKVITVANGKVTSVVDTKAEVDDDEKVVEEVKAEETVENPTNEGEETDTDAIVKMREEIDELFKIVDSILDKIGETRREADERLTKIEQMSAAQPAEVVIEMNNVNQSMTGVKSIDKLREMNQDWRKM